MNKKLIMLALLAMPPLLASAQRIAAINQVFECGQVRFRTRVPV